MVPTRNGAINLHEGGSLNKGDSKKRDERRTADDQRHAVGPFAVTSRHIHLAFSDWQHSSITHSIKRNFFLLRRGLSVVRKGHFENGC